MRLGLFKDNWCMMSIQQVPVLDKKHWLEMGIEYSELKLRLSPSKENCFIYFNKSSLKMMSDAFYFILKSLFILKIFKYLFWILGHVEKTA